jgi:O-antigen ligase
LEIHTLGVEIPLFAFLIIILAGFFLRPHGTESLGGLQNFLLIFVFTYALQVVKDLNKIFAVFITFATAVAIYAIWQHFTGIDLWRHTENGESTGLFNSSLTYSLSYLMIVCIPWAALLLSKQSHMRSSPWYLILFSGLSTIIIAISLILSFDRGICIALAVTLPLMAFFTSRKLFILTLLSFFLGGSLLVRVNPTIHDKFVAISASDQNNEDRKKLWHINFEMFRDHPWIGVGYKQNENLAQDYYTKLDVKDGPTSNARSNYVEILATTGLLGFATYAIFIIAYLLMTARLLTIIPATHHWHKVFALAALGAQVAFHLGGLFQWSLGIPEVQHQFFFWLAVAGYMCQRYFIHIVSDDRSL